MYGRETVALLAVRECERGLLLGEPVELGSQRVRPRRPFPTPCPGGGVLHALADVSCPRVLGNKLSIRSRLSSVSRGMGRQMAHMSAPAAVHHNVHPHSVQGCRGRCSAPQSASVATRAAGVSGSGTGTSRSRRARRSMGIGRLHCVRICWREEPWAKDRAEFFEEVSAKGKFETC